MSVALDAGYGSHEAFTRAFRKFFGSTPESVRASQSVNALNLLEAKTMTDLPNIELSDPEIAARGPLLVAGLKRRFKFSERGSIPGLWQEFIPLMLQVPDIRPGTTYGVVTGGLMGEDGFDYAAAIEIKGREDAPKGLDVIDIPKQRYAIFRHGGHVSEIGAVCSAIFGDWASNTTEALSDGAIQLLEHYPPCFDAMTGNGGFEIWLPLKG